ncbi:hypothetical protein ACWEOZ_12340 [Actinoplanes sp. NPDC004185]
MTAGRRELLIRAGDCYALAAAPDDAAECYVAAGAHLKAGEQLRSAGRWTAAAEQFRAARRWRSAAECYRAAGARKDAVTCWITAGDGLRAGWELVTSAAPRRAAAITLHRVRDLAGGTEPQSPADRLSIALLRALAEPDPDVSRSATATVLADLPGRLTGPAVTGGPDLLSWAVRAADLIERPDLAATLLAAAYEARVPGAADRWRAWAVDALGDATGIPER